MTPEQLEAIRNKGTEGATLARRLAILQDTINNLAWCAAQETLLPNHIASWAESLERDGGMVKLAAHRFVQAQRSAISPNEMQRRITQAYQDRKANEKGSARFELESLDLYVVMLDILAKMYRVYDPATSKLVVEFAFTDDLLAFVARRQAEEGIGVSKMAEALATVNSAKDNGTLTNADIHGRDGALALGLDPQAVAA